jgi:hypothetical protein
MVVETSDLKDFYHRPVLGSLHRPGLRTIHAKREMGAKPVIIGQVIRQQPPEMLRVEDEDMIGHVTADTANHPLHAGVLPRTPGGDEDFFDPHMAHPLSKSVPINAVPIAQQIPRGGLPRKSVHDLLSRPLDGGMLRDVHTHDPSPFMGEDDQDEEDPEPHGRDHKEIEGHHVPHVIR